MAGMMGSVILVAPWLFSVEVASAGVYKHPKFKQSEVTVSGLINAAVRKVDNGKDGRDNANMMVGQMGVDEDLSHIQLTAKTSFSRYDLMAKARVSSNYNSFSSYDADNIYYHKNITQNGDALVVYPPYEQMVHSDVLEVSITDNMGMLGHLNLGKAPTGTSESTKATFATTSYSRADISNVYAASPAAQSLANSIGYDFGSYELNHHQFRVQYTTAEYIKGLSMSTEYVSQSDQRTMNVPDGSPVYPRYDSHGFSASWKGSLQNVDLDLRAGYTSRAWAPFYRNYDYNNNLSVVDGGSWHLRGLGASAAFKYKGFDGSYAYAKLSPHNFVNQSQQFTNATSRYFRYGQKAAEMNSFELGYTFDLMGQETGFSGEYATSKSFFNDASKATIKGFRMAHKLSDRITMHAVLQEHSSNRDQVRSYDENPHVFVPTKNIKVGVLGFSVIV